MVATTHHAKPLPAIATAKLSRGEQSKTQSIDTVSPSEPVFFLTRVQWPRLYLTNCLLYIHIKDLFDQYHLIESRVQFQFEYFVTFSPLINNGGAYPYQANALSATTNAKLLHEKQPNQHLDHGRSPKIFRSPFSVQQNISMTY